ncbi:hypothetical protein [Streptomyces sp. NBC_01506]|uniref:hypothetical protein n=1 Tax=Streptomyces sp. NBC_01506 TaxID=2903887 RepID=UPI0038688817
MTPLQRATRRLVTGHRLNIANLTGWVKEKRETKSTVLRTAVLAATAWILWQTIGRTPGILWAVVLGWLVTAWRTAKNAPAEKPTPAAKTPTPADTPQQSIARWIAERIGDRPGIHLAELYPAMRDLDGMATHDDQALRSALRELKIPVERTIRVGDVEGRSGIRLKDLAPLLSPTRETTRSPDGDAGQESGERPESSVESPGDRSGEEAKAA